MRRTDRTAGLDPETDYLEIYRDLGAHEFPWDLNQALSFALFRTYAVPSIGRLLDATGQFTGPTQKRYDDTALLLEAPLVDGLDSPRGRAAIRRINQMHRTYDISNDDMVYVLSTFVVVPRRWIDAYGYRRLSETEVRASVRYYVELGRRMGIKDVPDTYDGFAALMDSYERTHFAYDPGARRVSDSTLALLASFYPRPARKAVERFSLAVMDDPLLAALRYDAPHPLARRLSHGALRTRGRMVALLPPRRRPVLVQDSRRQRTYRGGLPPVESMGTFAPGCPVHRPVGTGADPAGDVRSA
ncbi:DUF2236 domain-containing protein [Nocardioides sp. ChNu-153]|uniref:oxygenase MpaB family protein n=1 Tax=Nocardioides sp. ChNu-153 TaxID=2779364 RepID=UPI00264DBE94|nr:oxygenase MpaB family protein [Nocardioides sp. ChNu-153]MDN7122016.1 DUF2236 domain-containing protein [Nocardioides sp. ChNu-153]